MSVLTNLRWARQQRTGDARAKAVLLVITSHSDRDGWAKLSYRTIAGEAEIDEKTVRNHMPVLINGGFVEQRVAKGSGASWYRLLVDRPVRTPGAAQGRPRCAAPSSAQGDLFSEASDVRTSGIDEDPAEDRCADPASRSEDRRRSDQQRQTTEVEAEVEDRGGSAAPRASAPTRAGGRPREARGELILAAELDATAGRPAGAVGIVNAWSAGRRLLVSQKRELRQALDVLLRQGADPALLPAALDEVHDNARWRDPTRALGFAYREVERAAHRARAPAPTGPPGGIDARIDQFLNPGRTAIGGTP